MQEKTQTITVLMKYASYNNFKVLQCVYLGNCVCEGGIGIFIHCQWAQSLIHSPQKHNMAIRQLYDVVLFKDRNTQG